MFGRLLRVVLGFVAACLGAGLAMVLFVITPSELAGLPPDVATDRVGKALELAAFVAAQAALFSAPFALVIAAIGEWRHNRNWSFYALAGILMAVIGFFAQHSTEQSGQPTIVNNYAVIAFITSGFIGGLLYWLFSGRLAGGRQVEIVGHPVAPAASAPLKSSPSGSASTAKPVSATATGKATTPAAAQAATSKPQGAPAAVASGAPKPQPGPSAAPAAKPAAPSGSPAGEQKKS